MTTPDALMSMIRGEFLEMPGLRLTVAQACRLWQIDQATCEAILAVLIGEKFLHRTADGAYVALPSPRGTLRAAASMPPSRRTAS